MKLTSEVAWVIGAQGGLQFCHRHKLWDAWCLDAKLNIFSINQKAAGKNSASRKTARKKRLF